MPRGGPLLGAPRWTVLRGPLPFGGRFCAGAPCGLRAVGALGAACRCARGALRGCLGRVGCVDTGVLRYVVKTRTEKVWVLQLVVSFRPPRSLRLDVSPIVRFGSMCHPLGSIRCVCPPAGYGWYGAAVCRFYDSRLACMILRRRVFVSVRVVEYQLAPDRWPCSNGHRGVLA
jgi:hypothetical protein